MGLATTRLRIKSWRLGFLSIGVTEYTRLIASGELDDLVVKLGKLFEPMVKCPRQRCSMLHCPKHLNLPKYCFGTGSAGAAAGMRHEGMRYTLLSKA